MRRIAGVIREKKILEKWKITGKNFKRGWFMPLWLYMAVILKMFVGVISF